MGRTIAADAAVLAVGALPPAPPMGAEPELLASPRYHADPWRAVHRPDDLGGHVLLVGTGLTMVDVALTLARPGRRLTAISRRGLLPQTHAVAAPAPGRDDFAASPRDMLREVRRLSERRDWHEVIDEVRGSVRPLWMSWTQAERRQFLRHLRPWWDVHRHRMAPPVARRIDELRRTGELNVRAGVTERLATRRDEVSVIWRPRGARRSKPLKVDAVVNCTGFQGDLAAAGDRLLDDLLVHDLVRSDPCALGIDVDARSRPLNRWGAPTSGFYAVGPLTRGAFGEITSVPDIRHQALEVATGVLEHVRAIGRDEGVLTARPVSPRRASSPRLL
jgi:uncharacterized NAD(P)/FAD-binding protein YdhS